MPANDWLPKDWKRLDADGEVMVEREGTTMPLAEALILRDLLVSTSRPHLREAIRRS